MVHYPGQQIRPDSACARRLYYWIRRELRAEISGRDVSPEIACVASRAENARILAAARPSARYRSSPAAEGRYLAMQKARSKLATIRAALADGKRVQVSTYTQSTIFDARHVAKFKSVGAAVFAQYGRSWLCIDGAAIRFVS